jgi:ABC-type branched-subunit amino acid transport system ATPase component
VSFVKKVLKDLPPPPRLAPLLNKQIDSVLHPLAKKSKVYVLIDTAAHIAVEQADTFVESLHKFVKYNLEKLLR